MNIAPPIDGQWYWVHIPHHEDAYDKDGSEWSLAMRDSKESAGGWNNEDTWEDFCGEVDAWAGPIVAPDEVLKLDADEEKLAKAGRAGAAAGEKLRDAIPATPDPRRLLDALIEDLEAVSPRLKVSREEVSHDLWIRLTAIREAMGVVAILHGDPFAEPLEGGH